jgi:hypothetical protein
MSLATQHAEGDKEDRGDVPRGELARDLEVVAGRIVEGHHDALRLRPGELDRERSAVRQRVEQHAEALAADVVSALGSFDDTVER